MSCSLDHRLASNGRHILFFIALGSAFFIPSFVSLEAACGDFIARGENSDGTIRELREPIENCDNPFLLNDVPNITNVQFSREGEPLNQGEVIVTENFPLDLTIEVAYDDESNLVSGGFVVGDGFAFPSALYRHEDGDFVVLGLEDRNYTTVHEPGTYTIVFDISGPLTLSGLFHNLVDSLVPTAYAQSFLQPTEPRGVERVALTFAVEEEIIEPAGASSVLFLPGIMGSRLYEESDACDDSVREQERWFSIADCDQLRLLTRFDGKSINDIYTLAEDNAVIDEILIFPLYESFIESMNELEEEDVIADFVPFAYDWRLRLDDLLRTVKDEATGEVRYVTGTELTESHLYQTVEELVENSHSGNISIVAHSNGGLLAKVFLSALQQADDPLAAHIDAIFLIASPQVGTPDAVMSMLHGSEIGEGFVVSQQVARQLLNTAPFGHHLLPSDEYFDGAGVSVRSPVISFTPGSSTDKWIDAYGTEITDIDTLHQFLSKDSGREKPVVDDLYTPEVVDDFLLQYANTIAAVSRNWTPNPETKVYQIAGTGIETISGITYFTDRECVRGGFLWFECSEYRSKLGYYPNLTFDGDRTVVVPSALAMSETDNVDRLWLDLRESGEVHNNIFENIEVKNFIVDRLREIESPYSNFLSENRINPESDNRLSFFLFSPLDMYVESAAGITSSSTSDIPGTTYRRYGAVQYISVPSDATGITLHLHGIEEGSFTLLIQERDGNEVLQTKDFSAIPSGTSTTASLPIESFENIMNLEIDYDGNGTVDGVVTADTDVVAPVVESPMEPVPPGIEPPEEQRSNSSGTRVADRISPAPESRLVAGIATSSIEQWYREELFKILNRINDLVVLMQLNYAN